MWSISINQIRLFRSLFRGRTDVYAVRWEKPGKKGYSPVKETHSSSGFANLNDETIQKHLLGEITVGIYPILKDNSVYFAAVDFDKANWYEACRKVLANFKRYGIPAYLERSRSGNGGHLWLFFRSKVTAILARQFVESIMTVTFGKTITDKPKSFDRIFPNQDILSGKGFGNLLALPLQGNSLLSGNSAFLPENSLVPIEDQWAFLRGIQKISQKDIVRTFRALDIKPKVSPEAKKSTFLIKVGGQVELERNAIPSLIWEWLKSELTIFNPNYFVRKNSGKSTYGVEKTRSLIIQENDQVYLPERILNALIDQCEALDVDFETLDLRENHEAVEFQNRIILFEYQQIAIASIRKAKSGVIIAPPGAGKTVVALKAITLKGRRTLILVNRRQLLEQWINQIVAFFEIPKEEIGLFAGPLKRIGDQITVGMVQTLARSPKFAGWEQAFGTVVVDERHHAPAKQYQKVLNKLDCEFLFGLTATPIRKNKDEKFIFSLLGPVIARINPGEYQLDFELSMRVNIRKTAFMFPFDSKLEALTLLFDVLVHDSARNRLIVGDIDAAIKNGKKCLVISERKRHLEILRMYLGCNCVPLHGGLSKMARYTAFKQVENGEFDVALATGQFLGEGIDLPAFDVVLLVFPLSFEGKLVQYIGRAKRGGKRPEVFDYRDCEVPVLEKMFKKRLKVYRQYFGG